MLEKKSKNRYDLKSRITVQIDSKVSRVENHSMHPDNEINL